MSMEDCRFRNTAGDLADCANALSARLPLSQQEHKAAVLLVKICRRIADLFEGFDPAAIIPREKP